MAERFRSEAERYRRVATRREKARNFLAFVRVAAVMGWCGSPGIVGSVPRVNTT